jgi:hypothetical protein
MDFSLSVKMRSQLRTKTQNQAYLFVYYTIQYYLKVQFWQLERFLIDKS